MGHYHFTGRSERSVRNKLITVLLIRLSLLTSHFSSYSEQNPRRRGSRKSWTSGWFVQSTASMHKSDRPYFSPWAHLYREILSRFQTLLKSKVRGFSTAAELVISTRPLLLLKYESSSFFVLSLVRQWLKSEDIERISLFFHNKTLEKEVWIVTSHHVCRIMAFYTCLSIYYVSV